MRVQKTELMVEPALSVIHIQMRLDQVVNARGELYLGQMTAAGQHDETSVRQRGSKQFGIRRCRCDAVLLALNHQ